MGLIILLHIRKHTKFTRSSFNLKKYFIIDWYYKTLRQGWISEQNKKKNYIKFTRNDGTGSSIKILTKLKMLFSIQLPNIPDFYIGKQILDKKQIMLTLIRFDGKKKKITGSCCFRIFETNQFIELIFFAISTRVQGSGYGSYLMSFLKDFARSREIQYIITCADNNAINFFLKQGFSKILSNPISLWFRHIREYEDIELMECNVNSKHSNFFSCITTLLQKSLFTKKIQKLLKPRKNFTKLETKSNLKFNLAQKISEKQLKKNCFINLFDILDKLRFEKCLTPFFEPVDCRKMGILNYFEQFSNSIDVRSIEEKIRSKKIVFTEKNFFLLIKRMINNSILYNGKFHSIEEICLRLRKIFYSPVYCSMEKGM
jgi:histone acetyltransferase